MQILTSIAALAQLGERQTEDLKAPCSIHGGGTLFHDEFRKLVNKDFSEKFIWQKRNHF